MGIPQGDLKLLDSDMAKRLLNSKIPARLAYTAKDGTPRVIPTWFHWDGSELVMALPAKEIAVSVGSPTSVPPPRNRLF